MFLLGSLLAVAALVMSSCDGDGAVGPTTTSISISPANPELSVSETISLVASLDGVAAQPGTVFWSSADASIASVSESGVVTARAIGTALIAASAQGRSAQTTVTVVPPKVARVEVVPGVRSMMAGDTTTVRVTAYDANDVVLTGRAVTLTSATPTVVAVISGLRAVALAAGSARLTATVEGVSATVDIFVQAAAVATMELIPDSATVAIGATSRLVAITRDRNGAVLPGRPVTFSSNAETIASVTGDGTVVGVSPGRAVITASSGGASATAVIIVPPPTASQLTITPATATLVLGETVNLVAVLRDASGQVITGRPVAWKSSDLNVAYAAAGGLVTAAGLGSAVVTATSEGLSASAGITVVRAPVAAITLVPATLAMTVGDARQLTATARDVRGDPIVDVNFTWTSSAQAKVVVSSTGEVRALAAGSATITVSAGGVSAQTRVTVTRAPVTSVTLSPTSLALRKGATATLTATARNAAGAPVPEASIAWSTSNAAVASVSQTGVVTAISVGNAVIKATSEGISATASVTVSPPMVASLTITPTSLTLTTGETRTLVATARDAQNNVLPDVSVYWRSTTPGVATVDSVTGKVKAIAPGAAAITATSEGVSAAISVTVTRPAVARIDLTPSTLALTMYSPGEQLVAIARDASGVEVADAVIKWGTSASGVAIVSSTGVVTAVGIGSATITAFTTTPTDTVRAQASVVVSRALVNSVTVQPTSLSLRVGESDTLTAILLNAVGAPVPEAVVNWTSSDITVATVDPDAGIVRALTVGSTTIKATSEGKSGTATVTVTRRPVKTLTVTPASLDLLPGDSRTLVATARDDMGAVLPDAVVRWSSNATGVATVVDTTGRVTAMGVGTAVVTARSEGIEAAVPVTVTRLPVATITLSPISFSLGIGDSGQFVAVARDRDNVIVSGAVPHWESDNEAVATVTQTGLVKAVGNGTADIIVTSDGVAAVGKVVVSPPGVQSVEVTPNTLNLDIGATSQLSAIARDALGSVIPDAGFDWTSDNDAVAEVSPSGLVTARGAGSARIIATSQGKSDTATVTVNAAPPPSVDSVDVTPATLEIEVGESAQLVATAIDGDGHTVPGATFTWSSSDNGVATVSTDGKVQAIAVGTVTIRAVAGDKAGSASVTVKKAAEPPMPGPPSQILIVSGDGQRGEGGKRLREPLVVLVLDSADIPVPGVFVVWTTSDGSITPTLATTRADGTSEARWRLKDDEGAQSASAFTLGAGSVTFRAMAVDQ